jgi:hypothetical protein
MPDLFLFNIIKYMLKGIRNVTKELLALYGDEFRKCIQKVYG